MLERVAFSLFTELWLWAFLTWNNSHFIFSWLAQSRWLLTTSLSWRILLPKLMLEMKNSPLKVLDWSWITQHQVRRWFSWTGSCFGHVPRQIWAVSASYCLFFVLLVEELVREIEQHQSLRALCLEGNTVGVDAARAIAKALESKDMLQVLIGLLVFTRPKIMLLGICTIIELPLICEYSKLKFSWK